MMGVKSYSELIKIPTFEERYEYLRLGGRVGEETFGFDRWLNQMFYKSKEWLSARDIVIVRDCGCDLAFPGRPINGRIYIHHMNPVTKKDLLNRSDLVLNPEYLICVSYITHSAIHYGNKDLLIPDLVERKPNDTCPWKRR